MSTDADRFREETTDAEREECWVADSLARLWKQHGHALPWSDATAGDNQEQISEEKAS